MVDRTRKTVRKLVHYFTSDLEGTIDQAIERLTRYKEDYPGALLAYEDVDPYSHETRYGYNIYVSVPETDEEMAKRIAQEEKNASDRETRERREYEALKAKYGDQ